MSKAVSIMIVLMTVFARSDCGVLREILSKRQAMGELIQTLLQLTAGEVACGNTMVADVVFAGNAAPESFCKAARALLQAPSCKPIEQQLNNLIINLQITGVETSNCSLDENSEVEMSTFLISLKKFCKKVFSLQ